MDLISLAKSLHEQMDLMQKSHCVDKVEADKADSTRILQGLCMHDVLENPFFHLAIRCHVSIRVGNFHLRVSKHPIHPILSAYSDKSRE